MKRFRPRVNQSLSSLSFSTSSPRLLQKLEFGNKGEWWCGGGLRTGASCSWDLKKICNWFAVKGPVRSSSAKLSNANALAVNSDGRYLTTRGVDRHVHKCQGVHLRLGEIESCNYTRKVNKAEKLDGGEGGKWGESLVARTLGV
ncbi:hypothetical protein YC2023_006948 [Brassica napus]